MNENQLISVFDPSEWVCVCVGGIIVAVASNHFEVLDHS